MLRRLLGTRSAAPVAFATALVTSVAVVPISHAAAQEPVWVPEDAPPDPQATPPTQSPPPEPSPRALPSPPAARHPTTAPPPPALSVPPYPGGGYPPPLPYGYHRPTRIVSRGVPAVWATGLGVFLAAYLIPPIVAGSTEGNTHGLEIPLAGWIIFLTEASCPDDPDGTRDSACVLGIIGAVWGGVLQLAGAGLFTAGLLMRRERFVMQPVADRVYPRGLRWTIAPMLRPDGAGLAVTLR